MLIFGRFASLCSFHTYIMKLSEVGVRLDTGGRWVRDEGTFCLLFVQMLGIVVDTGKLFQTKPEPSLRELGGLIQHCLIGYRGATSDITDECQDKSCASFLSKLFIESHPYGHCWLGCMVKKLEHHTFSQS